MGSRQEFFHPNSVKSTRLSADKSLCHSLAGLNRLGKRNAVMRNMELLGRACAALGISLVLTLLLLVLYQDDPQQTQVQPASASITQASTTAVAVDTR